mmetsp:Transcript_29235/g.69413  ORF Transcript_29235/g.69413 Transcript_29235/m.69413 type:complete len:88 (-) Transcript_29235:409-672(-)|eukprot:1732242-Rhodomonas_salina.1
MLLRGAAARVIKHAAPTMPSGPAHVLRVNLESVRAAGCRSALAQRKPECRKPLALSLVRAPVLLTRCSSSASTPTPPPLSTDPPRMA